jgi:anti-anti-sigma factor
MTSEQLARSDDVDPYVLGARSKKHCPAHLTPGGDTVTVTLEGDIDIAAVDSLERVLTSLDLITAGISVDMQAVTFIDSSGLFPLLEAARRRKAHGLAPILIGQCSARASLFLRLLKVNPKSFDADGWDRDMTSVPEARSSHTSCTSALCQEPAEYLVSWKGNPGGLPFCGTCAGKLREHGDRVGPLGATTAA